MTPACAPARFDDRQVHWMPFGDLPHFLFSILHIDEPRGIADVLFRFSAGQQIVLHRHLAANHTFVIQGEHRLYEADGTLREIRPAGTLTVSPASEVPHREGGGPEQDAIVLFSMRPEPGQKLYEILADDGTVIADITLDTLRAIRAA
ncbi:quercetin dioxygenase-like cupin family protein [Sphaerotilus sulfidivorans]|uniref:Quercetin dioxygenase-like cupin family protein n=2 Tax=Sphaerotilus sulfidivorans TaxID=639200 RepID=A0ABV2IJD6_9BURK|nr:regulator [Sphaerotilus sulfidivorans]